MRQVVAMPTIRTGRVFAVGFPVPLTRSVVVPHLAVLALDTLRDQAMSEADRPVMRHVITAQEIGRGRSCILRFRLFARRSCTDDKVGRQIW